MQIRASCAMFKVKIFNFEPYLESIYFLEKYIGWLEKQLMDIVRNPDHRVIKQNLSAVMVRTLPNTIGGPDHIKVPFLFLLCLSKLTKKFYIIV